MKGKRVGLILGKVAPFHKGHNFLIDTALKIVDELIFVVYDCPDRIHIPTNMRADWIRKQYPQINVIEGWDAPNEHNDSDLAVQRKQENYISKILKGKKITHFISSEKYGEHMSKFLRAENVVVDMERKKINISSTIVRGNLYKHREYIPSVVYYDLITKIALVGFDWKSINSLTKMITKKYKTVSGSLLQVPSDKKDLLKMIKRKKGELYDETLIKNADTFAFYSNTLIEGYTLLQGIERDFSSEIRNEALKQLRDFDIIFLNQTDNKMINGINSRFLNNQLIAQLKANKINYIQLVGNYLQKEKQIEQVLALNLKTKKFI